MSSTWGRLASEALPTGCSWHDQASSERRGGRRRRSARQRGLARYLGPGIAICLATPRKLWARRMAGVVAWLDIQNCAKASPSSREIAFAAPAAIEVARGRRGARIVKSSKQRPGLCRLQSRRGPLHSRGGDAGHQMPKTLNGSGPGGWLSRPITWRRTSRLNGPGLACARPGRSA